VVATIDSSVITSTVAVYPGSGLDSNFIRYDYPGGSPTDTVFVMTEIMIGNLNDSLIWAATEYIIDSTIPISSFKTPAAPTAPPLSVPPYLFLDVMPNPFNRSTTVKIRSAENMPTHVEVYDQLGRKITDLFNGNFPSSDMEIKFEPAMVATGAYYIRVVSGDEVVTRKILLLK